MTLSRSTNRREMIDRIELIPARSRAMEIGFLRLLTTWTWVRESRASVSMAWKNRALSGTQSGSWGTLSTIRWSAHGRRGALSQRLPPEARTDPGAGAETAGGPPTIAAVPLSVHTLPAWSVNEVVPTFWAAKFGLATIVPSMPLRISTE